MWLPSEKDRLHMTATTLFSNSTALSPCKDSMVNESQSPNRVIAVVEQKGKLWCVLVLLEDPSLVDQEMAKTWDDHLQNFHDEFQHDESTKSPHPKTMKEQQFVDLEEPCCVSLESRERNPRKRPKQRVEERNQSLLSCIIAW
jgi:hypothetical protein